MSLAELYPQGQAKHPGKRGALSQLLRNDTLRRMYHSWVDSLKRRDNICYRFFLTQFNLFIPLLLIDGCSQSHHHHQDRRGPGWILRRRQGHLRSIFGASPTKCCCTRRDTLSLLLLLHCNNDGRLHLQAEEHISLKNRDTRCHPEHVTRRGLLQLQQLENSTQGTNT